MGSTPAPAPAPPPPAPVEAWAPSSAEQDEARELQELHELLGKKEGSLPRGVYVKLQVAHENRMKADEIRAERQAAEALLDQRAKDTTERIQAHRLATKDKVTALAESEVLTVPQPTTPAAWDAGLQMLAALLTSESTSDAHKRSMILRVPFHTRRTRRPTRRCSGRRQRMPAK